MHGRWLPFYDGFERHLEAKVVGFLHEWHPLLLRSVLIWYREAQDGSLSYDADYYDRGSLLVIGNLNLDFVGINKHYPRLQISDGFMHAPHPWAAILCRYGYRLHA